jgi:DNA-binding IclR family transcriptional regulator
MSISPRPHQGRVLRGPTQRIQAIDRAVHLLQAIAASSHSPTLIDLAASCGLNRSTAWRLLGTLEHHGLVARDSVTQGYTLGFEVVALASRTDYEPLLRRARPILQEYAKSLGETLTLAVPRGFDLVYVDQVDPPGVVRPSWLGQLPVLHATSSGKVFLASLSSRELEAVIPEQLERFTEHTLIDKESLLADLSATRARGYGTCDREYEEYSNGVAAPVVGYAGRPLAIVAIWAPSQRVTAASMPDYGRRIIAAADDIAARLHST